METALSKILAQIDPSQLPAIPKVLLKLIEAFQNPETGFDDLARIIAQDAALSSKVLAAANSAYYQQFGELKDLNRVLVVLGLETLKTITMTSVVQQFFNHIPLTQQNQLEAIWRRSLACAYFARRLAKLTGFDSPDLAYLTGLLHRIGQLALLQCFPKEYVTILQEHGNDPPEALEQQTLGITHNEIGSYIIDSWQIDGFIADAVLYQQKEPQAILDSTALVKLINLAAKFSRLDKAADAYADAFELFGLGQPLLKEIVSDVEISVEQTSDSLGIATVNPQGGSAAVKAKLEERNAIFKQLGEHAKELALLGAISRDNEASTQLDQVITAIGRDLNILFGFRSTAVFMTQSGNSLLAGYAASDRIDGSLLSKLSIDLKPNRSLLANALLQKKTLDSFRTALPDPTPVVDRQIGRILGSDGFVAIPLTTKGKDLGVIVAGLKSTELPQCQAKFGLMTLFAAGAARMLLNYRQIDTRVGDEIAAIRSEFQLHAKQIVHEANNPLSIINNYLYLLGRKLDNDAPQELALIQEEINRVGEIILRLADAPENDKIDEGPIDIHATITSLLALFREGLFATKDIEVDVKLDSKIPPLCVSKAKLKQILTNLLKNAAEAQACGGRVEIVTRDRVYLGNHCFIEIEIRDTGPGLPDSISDNLFRPVTSTKGGNHSGLGLTIVKNLVDELGGTIGCTSRSGEGTTFQIYLPRKVSP